MAMGQSINAAPPKHSRRWRFAVIFLGLLAVLAAAFVAWTTYRNAAINHELADALVEVNAIDPHWQLEEFEANRAKISDGENSALLIGQIAARIPRPDPGFYARHQDLLVDLSPEVRLAGEQYTALIDELEQVEAAVGPALALARYPRGRHPITISPDVLSTRLMHFNDCAVVQMRVLDALTPVLIHEGNSADALEACRASLNLGRSLGDELWTSAYCIRGRFAGRAIRGVERLLGQGEVPETALAALQDDLAAEASYDPWTNAMRGYRAELVRVQEAVEDGRINASAYHGWVANSPRAATLMDHVNVWLDDRVNKDTRAARTATLRYFTRLIDTGRLAWPERRVAVAAIAADVKDWPEPTLFVVPLIDRLMTVFQLAAARNRCAVAAIATERYRIRHGHWPNSLTALVPEFLPAAPGDPFDGQPLRFKRLADGIVVYSVGPDTRDDGGTLADAEPHPIGTDIGFRLWDVPKRGQAPNR